MGSKYTALTIEERRLIQRVLDAGSSRRKIALQLGRSPGTISRELGKNGQGPEGYEAASAVLRLLGGVRLYALHQRAHAQYALMTLQPHFHRLVVTGGGRTKQDRALGHA